MSVKRRQHAERPTRRRVVDADPPTRLLPPKGWARRGATPVDARVFRAFAEVLRALAPLTDAEKTRVLAAAAALLATDEADEEARRK